MTIAHRYIARTSGSSPRATVRYRTPIGILEIARHNPHRGAITLTIAEGRRLGLDDEGRDARLVRAAQSDQYAAALAAARRYGLAVVEIHAARAHGDHLVREIEIEAERDNSADRADYDVY